MCMAVKTVVIATSAAATQTGTASRQLPLYPKRHGTAPLSRSFASQSTVSWSKPKRWDARWLNYRKLGCMSRFSLPRVISTSGCLPKSKIALSSMSDRTRLNGAILVTNSRLPCIASGESLSCPVGNGHRALGALLPGLDAATCMDSRPRVWGRFVIQPCCRSGISRIVHSYERALDLLSILSFRPSLV